MPHDLTCVKSKKELIESVRMVPNSGQWEKGMEKGEMLAKGSRFLLSRGTCFSVLLQSMATVLIMNCQTNK